MAASPDQQQQAHIEDVLSVIADIRLELEPVELRLEQRRRTPDEHTDWRVVCQQRRELIRLGLMLAQLSKYKRT